MFKTAMFKVHNPSRHKRTILLYALKNYHLTMKGLLESVLADLDLAEITKTSKSGKPHTDQAALSRILYALAPKGWPLAPLRDYLVGDAAAMLMSHFEKQLKGKNESNPPTVHTLTPLTAEEQHEARVVFATTQEFPLRPDHAEEIAAAEQNGQVHRARRLGRIYASRATSNAMRDLLRTLETPLPRPIEFTRCEFSRGFLLARKENKFYFLARLFGKTSSRWEQTALYDGFTNCRTGESIGGKTYPGVILPLEFGRDFHDIEYLQNGKPQSAKLMIRRGDDGAENFYVHIAFEFTPKPIPAESYLGIDRGAAMIGAASIVSPAGALVGSRIDMEGVIFNRELKRYALRIAAAQKKNQKKPRLFRLRRRFADAAIGEYANRVVSEAVKHKSRIVFEMLDARSMARFLSRSQFAKLQASITYKAAREGLEEPLEVPAAYTSQTCAGCGCCSAKNRPKKDSAGKSIQDLFLCIQCGYSANADQNASEIIALRALHQIQNGGKYQTFPVFQQWLIGMRQVGKADAVSSVDSG